MPVKVTAWPSESSLFIFSSPSTTPNQKVAGRPMRHRRSPGSASPTSSAATAWARSGPSSRRSQGIASSSAGEGLRARWRSGGAARGAAIVCGKVWAVKTRKLSSYRQMSVKVLARIGAQTGAPASATETAWWTPSLGSCSTTPPAGRAPLRCAKRPSACGRRSPGPASPTWCKTWPWAWPPRACGAASTSSSSARTARGSTPACSRPRPWAPSPCRCTRTRSPRNSSSR
mmetsp:Transcript_59388/g.140266  ORF Transcript_59388/g.140266 Transcript_59388/m.140266 type:complete len:230 (+) Transcript_59388:4947-5636(+)